MRAVLAVAACAAAVATAGAVNHLRTVNATPRCSAAAATKMSTQDPAAVAAYWTADRVRQAQQNMRNSSATMPSAKRGCRAVQ